MLLINAVEQDEQEERPLRNIKPIVESVEPIRRSPRIPIPNKRYVEEDQEPEQEIIKAIPTKTKKAKPIEPINEPIVEPIEPLRRSSRTPMPNKR